MFHTDSSTGKQAMDLNFLVVEIYVKRTVHPNYEGLVGWNEAVGLRVREPACGDILSPSPCQSYLVVLRRVVEATGVCCE